MDTESLENAINSAKSETPVEAPVQPQEAPRMGPEEEIGFHKGALNTLMAERGELLKMVSNVEAIASAHAKRLEELGVKLN